MPSAATWIGVAALGWIALSLAADEATAPTATALLQRFVDSADRLAQYQVVMTKQQRLGSELSEVETLLLKHRREPECRYMKWIGEVHRSRELILCDQRYGGRIQVHEPGLLGFTTFSLAPVGSFARHDSLRPITEAGVYSIARTIRRQVLENAGLIDGASELSRRDVDGQDSLCLRRERPGIDAGAPYPVGAVELCFDRQTALPTEVQFWHLKGQLMEHYRFRDWQLDIALSDADFDTANKAYGF